MVFTNIFSTMALRAQFRIFKYRMRLRRLPDADIQAIVEHESKLRAWCSERSYYLAALRSECHRRGIHTPLFGTASKM